MSSSSYEIVLTSSPDGPITAYHPFSGTTVARFTGSRSPRHGLALVGNSYIAASHMYSSTVSGLIHLYNWWSSTALHFLPVPEPVAPLAASLDGSYLFAGGLSGNVHVLSIPSGKILKSFPAHSKPVSCLSISNDWSLLISGSDDGSIVVVPIFELVQASRDENSSNLIMHCFVAHDGPVTAITCSIGLCYSIIISCSIDCTCKVWSLMNGMNLHTVTFPCGISGLALDPTETEFYAAGLDGSVYKGCLKVGSKKQVSWGRELVTWPEKHGGPVVSVVLINEGKNLVSAAEDGSVYIWEVDRGQVIIVLGNNMESISGLVVASETGYDKQYGVRVGTNVNECGGGGGNDRLPDKELSISVKNTVDMEEVLAVAAKDKSKAIDMLESAIAAYERLLELILKEAKGGTSKNNEKEKDDK